MRLVPRSLPAFAFALFLAACETISPFSLRAYEFATSTKAEALALMDKATEPAESHAAAIQALQLNLDKGYEYARGRPKNDESTRQWDILRDPEKNSIGGFLARWKARKQLSAVFIKEAKPVIADGFDQVIDLESGKRKAN
jgi:hypothetical protein